jgi:predicted RNA-binding protein YlqC (UPF0109 family)
MMEEFLEGMARRLVDHPDRVHVDCEQREEGLIFRLSVDPTDVGKVIGKQGRTAQALRTLLIAVAARGGKRAMLEILQ